MEQGIKNGCQAVPQNPAQPVSPDEISLIQARSAAQFALTPIGQQVKQFEVQQRMAQMYATSTIVPKTYSGNLGNCVIALDMAMRMQANPLMVMQNLYVVHGNPAFSSKFLIATINASGRFTPLRYEFRGKEGTDGYACRCLAYEAWDKEHKEPLYGDWVSIDMAKKEGWFSKDGSKWQSMPNQMLRYRAAAFWQRVYCPEISMGLMTSEEAEDVDDQSYLDYRQEIARNANGKEISVGQDLGAEAPSAANESPAPHPQPREGKQSEPQAEEPLGASSEIPLFMQQ